MKKILVTLLFSLPLFLFSQGENDNWYFGTFAAVNFTNPAAPAVFTDNKQAGPATGSVSDGSGKLLFYTNGKQILTREHQLMQNGDLQSENVLGLTIVQHPGNNRWYYVFMMVQPVGDTPYLKSSIVDMSQGSLGANGLPLGTVLNEYKNTMIYTAYQPENSMPQFAVIKHANGNAFWLVTHDGDRLYSFLFDHQGIHMPLTMSFLNISPPAGSYASAIKASAELGSTSSFSNYLMLAMWPNSAMKVFSFNNQTGLVTNDYQLAITGQAPNIGEFNKDGSILYIGRNNDSRIFAFDLVNSTNTAIYRQVYYNSNSSLRARGMQINRYGDIYLDLNSSGYLSKITNPNTFASASVDLNNLYLSGKTGWQYLPNIVHTFRGSIGCVNSNEISNTNIKGDLLSRVAPCRNSIGQDLRRNINQQKISLKVNLDKPEVVNTNINIYPNPAADILSIESSAKINGVEIYDISGKKIEIALNVDKVNVKNLSSGTYLIRIETEAGMISKQFIKK